VPTSYQQITVDVTAAGTFADAVTFWACRVTDATPVPEERRCSAIGNIPEQSGDTEHFGMKPFSVSDDDFIHLSDAVMGGGGKTFCSGAEHS